jgi:hypothetical protein
MLLKCDAVGLEAVLVNQYSLWDQTELCRSTDLSKCQPVIAFAATAGIMLFTMCALAFRCVPVRCLAIPCSPYMWRRQGEIFIAGI